MTNKSIALWLVLILSSLPLFAQETTNFTEANNAYKKGISFYEMGLFAKAQVEFNKTLRLLQPVNESRAELLRAKAELHVAKSAVQLELPEGEKLILDFVRKYSPEPIASQAIIEIANYYYNAKDFDKAIEFYKKAPTNSMTTEQRAEVKFRQGYALFVQKQFTDAKLNFLDIKDFETKYYYPANYYLGLCHFFEGDYNEAIESFRVVDRSRQYAPHVPYYLAQIYFAERRFDDLIQYAEPKLGERSNVVKKQREIGQLVGQAYFERGQYAQALPYLEEYAQNTGKLREEEFFQLGFTQYQTGKYVDAIRSFVELAPVDSKLGQMANYYLADCYLKIGQRPSARAAFANAKRMNYDPQIQEEAQFNYAKLSYELKDPRESLNALQTIEPSSKYYTRAQTLMSEIFLGYRDYQQAMEIIEKIPKDQQTPQIRESYQKVTYYRGLQLYREDQVEAAKLLFNKSLQEPLDVRTKALATYWLGDIAHQEEDYNGSIRRVNQFLTMAKAISGLPDEASLFTGNYTMGYNYMKQENYPAALGFFQETVDGIRRNRSFIKDEKLKNDVLGDATMRAGDCYFKRNQYSSAVKFYDDAIDARFEGYEYALYQKAIIEGLRGRTTEKILTLERIPKEFPESEFADDALYQLGATYQSIGQLNQAVPPLRKLISDYRFKSDLVNDALLRLGLVSYNQGNLETAINYYKQVFSNNPTTEEANLALSALEEIYVNDLGQANQYFAFLETIPGYKLDNFAKDSINFKAAESQFENANYERAVEGYTNYLRQFPQGRYKLTAYFHRGESYSVLRQYSLALQDYKYVVDQGNSRYYLKALEKAAIIAYNHEEDFASSYDLYSKLELAATTENMRFEAQLGALRSAYRSKNASAVYSLASKVGNNPNATPLQVATANFYLGKMAYDQRDFDNALLAFNEVVRLSDTEQTAEARYLIATIYYQRRDLERAQQLCINANKESSGYPYWVAKSVILLSDIFAEKGDLLNARAALEALLENYKEDPTLVAEAQRKLNQINVKLNQGSRLSRDNNSGTLEMDDGNN